MQPAVNVPPSLFGSKHRTSILHFHESSASPDGSISLVSSFSPRSHSFLFHFWKEGETVLSTQLKSQMKVDWSKIPNFAYIMYNSSNCRQRKSCHCLCWLVPYPFNARNSFSLLLILLALQQGVGQWMWLDKMLHNEEILRINCQGVCLRVSLGARPPGEECQWWELRDNDHQTWWPRPRKWWKCWVNVWCQVTLLGHDNAAHYIIVKPELGISHNYGGWD